MKKTFPHDARPTESQEERRSLLPFAVPLCRLRLATAGQILSLGTALALLSLAVPDASAQQITSPNPDKDFNTLGIAEGNKGPQGLWSDGTTMLVSDVDGKIYSYDLETTQRQDSHHNDGKTNADDFFLYKSGTSGPKIRPYGIWATNSILWVASAEGKGTNKTAKLYAYTITWNTNDVRTDLDGKERYLKGDRDSTKDINLHKEITSLPDLDDDGNPIVFEVHTNNGRETRHRLSYDPEVVTEGRVTNTVYHLLNKDGNRLTRNSEGKLTTQDGVVYENENISFQTNMVTGPVGNLSPTGIWSDGTTIWVADQGATIEFDSTGKHERFFSPDRIYAYNLWTTNEMDERVLDGSLNTNKVIQLSVDRGSQEGYDYTLDKNTYAQGLWSDGETMWVANIRGAADSDEKRIYAYNMWTNSPTGGRIFDGSRDSDKDYKNLNKEGNLNDNDRPRGIWSDGTTMWVADQTDNKLYAYHGFLSPTTPNDKQDFDTLKAAGNNVPKGMWSDEETLWVADGDDDKLFAYNLATKKRDSDKEIDLDESLTDLQNEDNSDPSGIWSDRTTIWVADDVDDKLYAYNLATKARVSGEDIPLDPANSNPRGLWANETIIWVADSVFTMTSTVDGKSITRKKLFAYKRNLGEDETEADRRVSGKDIPLDPANSNPSDIWSDKTTIWVADTVSDKLYAYKLANGDRVSSKDFGTLDSENTTPTGLWSDGATMWVVDDHPTNSKRDKIYAYRLSNAASLGELELTGHVPSKEYEDFEEIQLRPFFDSGTTRYTASVPYATESLTVSPKTLRPRSPGNKDGVSYSPTGTATTKGRQFDLNVGENTISVTVTNGQATGLPRTRTYTVDVTREFFTYNDPSKNIMFPTNFTVQGIWANETTLYVSTIGTNKIHAYNKANRTRDVTKDIGLHADNADPRGIWSDGTTMWVVDDTTGVKLYAYKLELGEGETETEDRRVSSQDFNLIELSEANNLQPEWIWSDGVTMWVSDNATITDIVNGKTNTYQKIYAYNMSDKKRNRNKENSLKLKNLGFKSNSGKFGHFTGMWSDGATLWIADKEDDKIYAFKRNKEEIDCPDATEDFNTLAAVDNTDPEAIFSDGSTMWVVDNTAKKIFAYNQPLSANNKLKRLELSNVYSESTSMPISEVFSSVTNNYSAYVVYANLSTTVDAIAQDPDAGVSIQPKDADPATPGHQVNLADGDNTIIITVAAENAVIQEYTINVARKSGGRTPIRDFDDANLTTMTMMNFSPTGLWGNDTTIYVADKGGGKIYAYDLKNKAAVPANGFNMLEGMTTPWGIWSDGTNMWAVETLQRAEKILAYRMSDKKRDSDKEINASELYSSSIDKGPTGLWADGTNMWVADDKALDIYAYNMWTTNNQQRIWDGNRNDTEDFGFETSTETVPEPKTILDAAGNKNPLGIWSDETTMWVANGDPVRDENVKIYAYNLETKARDSAKDIDNLKDQLALDNRNEFKGGIWSDGTTMWVSVVHSDSRGKNLYAFNLPKSGARLQSDPSEDSTLKDLQLSGIGLNPVFSPDNTIYTALADHDVASTTVTATPNHSAATVKIFWASDGAASKSTASKGPYVALQEGYNIIVIDVEAEDGNVESYWIEVTRSEAPPVSGGPLPQPQSFQPSTTSSANQADLAGSAAGSGEWKSQLIFAEPLLDGGVRFVFLVPAAEEFKIETTPDLLSGEWRALADDEVQMIREDNGDGRDRLTVILPQAEEKQRFLRLTPQR